MRHGRAGAVPTAEGRGWRRGGSEAPACLLRMHGALHLLRRAPRLVSLLDTINDHRG
jgi:hypothetical protein